MILCFAYFSADLLDELQPRIAQALKVMEGINEQAFMAHHLGCLDNQYEQRKVRYITKRLAFIVNLIS